MKIIKNVLLGVLCTSMMISCQRKESKTDYADIVSLFREFREFVKPDVVEGVPDYTAEAMQKQWQELKEYQKRLVAIDTSGWPISQQVDYHIVRAEMNGLEFDHRVLRPWSRDPSFYAVITTSEPDVPAREGPEIYGVLYMPDYEFPLKGEQKKEFQKKIQAVPILLAQAKKNLTEKGRDLWYFGIIQKEREINVLTGLSRRLMETNPDLVPLVDKAREAVGGFKSWLEEEHGSMARTSDGIGKQNFNWYMKHVHLAPFNWQEQVEICQRELERSWTALKLEEVRNRDLPPLELADSINELQNRLKAAMENFVDFLKKKNIFTVPDYMHLGPEIGIYTPPENPEKRCFFTIVDYHHCLPLRTHMVHWLEKQREKRNEHPKHPIRSVPLLYNIWDSRAEGLATGFEEVMLQTGLLDTIPRARELTYILLAFRAARALGDLMVHSGDWTVQEAVDFAAKATPRGWLKPNDRIIWGDMGLYLRQPGYGSSYVYGKIQLERLIADRARQLGDEFCLHKFFDNYFSRGIIPASLIRWEITGLGDEIKKIVAAE